MIGKIILAAALISSVFGMKIKEELTSPPITNHNTTEPDVCYGAGVGELVPSPNSCTQYYFCHPAVDPVRLYCEQGKHFSHALQECVDPAISGCIEGLKCPEDRNIVIAHPYVCESYIICYKGFAHVRECANNLRYNRFTENCDFADRVDCLSCPSSDSATLVFYPSNHSCDLGYICMDGEPREIRCNNGLHWNNQTNQCDLPRSANCTISQGTNGFN